MLYRISIFFALAILSCQQRNTTTKIQEMASEAERSVPRMPDSTSDEEASFAPKEVLIEFDDFAIRILNYAYLRGPNSNKDTIQLFTDLGESLENKLIQIIPREPSDRFQVSVSLQQNLTTNTGERQWETLGEWTYFDPYKDVADSLGYFRIRSFQRQERFDALYKDQEKIKERVRLLKGEYITKELDTIANIRRWPIELWIERVMIRIIQQHKDDSRQVWYVNAISPYGC